MSETNPKSPRTFQCREALWQRFEEMARELECSVDYLINDAMKQYARQRGYSGSQPHASPSGPSASPAPFPLASSAPRAASPRPAPLPGLTTNSAGFSIPSPSRSLPPRSTPVPAAPMPPPVPSLPTPLAAPLPPPGASRVPLPPLPSGAATTSIPSVPPLVGGPALPPIPSRAPGPVPPLPGRGPVLPTSATPVGAPPLVPPPVASARNPEPSGTRLLTVYYQGTQYPVTKEHFVIGRGKQASDLTIRDPNISRQHAAIEYSGGSFWMVDLGSTNGVEFNGQRVQRKQIQNGDVYKICSHELFMTLA